MGITSFGEPLRGSSFFDEFLGLSQQQTAVVHEESKSILPFFSSIETKKKALSIVEEDFAVFKKVAEEARKSLADVFSKITYELTQSKDEIEKIEADKSEYLNKKITFLNDRKQNLLTYQDLFKAIEDTFVSRIAKLNEHIDFLQNKQKLVLKPLYSWQDFRDLQTVIAKLTNRFDELHGKKRGIG